MKMESMLSRQSHGITRVIVSGCIFLTLLVLLSLSQAEEPGEERDFNIQYVSSFGGNVNAAVAHGQYIYAGQRDVLRVLDNSDPHYSKEVTSLRVDGVIDSMSIRYPALYFSTRDFDSAHGYSGIIDISDPQRPKLVKTPGSEARGKEIEAVFKDSKRIIFSDGRVRYIDDISNPLNPIELKFDQEAADQAYYMLQPDSKSYKLGNNVLNTRLAFASDIKVIGRYAYVLDQNSGINVIDISDPTKPRYVGNRILPGNPETYPHELLTIHDTWAFVADEDHTLHILDISKLTTINMKASIKLPETIRSIWCSGNYAFVESHTDATTSPSLQVLDLAHQPEPRLLGSYKQGMPYAEDQKIIDALRAKADMLDNTYRVVVRQKDVSEQGESGVDVV